MNAKLPHHRLLPLALAITAAAPVASQTEGLIIEEVVVTAQKRAQSLADVPASVQAMTSEELENAGIQDFGDLVRVSSSLGLQDNLSPWQRSVVIRGVGTNVNSPSVESSVSTVVDGVVLGIQGQFFTDLVDIERVEVLRGPQSTLFGKNASAGVLNIVTRKPSLDGPEGIVEVAYDEFAEARLKGSYSAPISDSVAYRISGNVRHVGENFIENVNPAGQDLDGAKGYMLRGKLLWDINDNLEALFTADYSDSDSPSGVRVFRQTAGSGDAILQAGATRPITAGPGNRRVSISDPNEFQVKDWGLSAEFTWQLDNHTLTSITAYREWQLDDQLDIDSNGLLSPALSLPPVAGGGVPYFRGTVVGERESQQLSQELRLQSDTDGRLQYIVGAFLWNLDLEQRSDQRRELCFGLGPLLSQLGTACDQVEPVPLPPLQLAVSGGSDTDTSNEYYALFTQIDYDLTDRLMLNVGARVQRETFEYSQSLTTPLVPGDQPVAGFDGAGKESDTEVTGKIGLQYAFNDDSNGYLSYARGYKGAGIESGPFQPVDLMPLAPETVDAWELGYKTRLLGGRLALDSALFWQEFQNTQVLNFNPEASTFESVNAGKSRQQGVEVDARFRATRDLDLTASVTYLDTEYQELVADCYLGDPDPQCAVDGSKSVDGQRTTFAPEWKAVLGGRYVREIPGLGADGFVQLNYRWQSEVQYALNQNPLTEQDSYGVLDLSFGLDSIGGRLPYTLTVFAYNLTGENFVNNLLGTTDSSGLGVNTLQFVPKSANRYVGASLRIRF
jgi:iron complex outermembrane receptor protein